MDAVTSRQSCSFCGEPGRDGGEMAGGLGAFICGSCLDHFAGVFAELRRTGREDPPPWHSMSDADLLGKLPLIARTGAQVDRFLVDWVRLVRSRGLSWAQVGGALGISRQAAWERFARQVEAPSGDDGLHAVEAGSA
ncbi:MAG: hypothetical protein HOQ45_13170 [Nocardioidaceae bacterium]|nr:hypothetical protein [Nocardioidaceae bacterium]